MSQRMSDLGARRAEGRSAWLLAAMAVLAYLLPLWLLTGLASGAAGLAVVSLAVPLGIGVPWLAFGRQGWRSSLVAAVAGVALGLAVHAGSGFARFIIYVVGVTLGTIVVAVAATAMGSLRDDTSEGNEVGLALACLWLVAWGTHALAVLLQS